MSETREALAYVQQYGPRCRDCADENGICPGSGLPCAGTEKAIKYVLDALSYGFKHGFLELPAEWHRRALSARDERAEADSLRSVVGELLAAIAGLTKIDSATGKNLCELPLDSDEVIEAWDTLNAAVRRAAAIRAGGTDGR